MKSKVLLVFILSLFILACKKDKDVPKAYLGDNYAGMNIGQYIVYDVDSIVYDDFFNPVKIDTFQFKIKEVIEDYYTDAGGRQGYKMVRYKKETDTTDWVLRDVWHCYLSRTTFEQIEENERFIKLIFPVRDGKTWNGNSMNNLSAWEYEYTNVHAAESYSPYSFDSVLTVTQIDDENLIEKKLSIEKYATNVGMVYKKYQMLNTEINGTIKSGVDYTMTISSYGN